MATMPRAFRNIQKVVAFEAAKADARLRALNARIEAARDEADEAEAPSVSEMTRETVEADFFGSRA